MRDDGWLSKNHGESVKYRRRLIEEKEARMAREDALRDIAEYLEVENEREKQSGKY
jgi:hypothetical protein